MHSRTDRGEGRLSSLIWLAFFLALGYSIWHVAPAYMANYTLNDKMNEIARTPRGGTTDEKVVDMLMKYVREEGLDPYIQRTMFRVATSENNRRIMLSYDRTTEVLPGWKHVIHFSNQVDQPLIW